MQPLFVRVYADDSARSRERRRSSVKNGKVDPGKVGPMKYSIQNSFGDLSFDCTGTRENVDCTRIDCLELFAKFAVANPCTFCYFDVTRRAENPK